VGSMFGWHAESWLPGIVGDLKIAQCLPTGVLFDVFRVGILVTIQPKIKPVHIDPASADAPTAGPSSARSCFYRDFLVTEKEGLFALRAHPSGRRRQGPRRYNLLIRNRLQSPAPPSFPRRWQ
jgi:hypothetical protein